MSPTNQTCATLHARPCPNPHDPNRLCKLFSPTEVMRTPFPTESARQGPDADKTQCTENVPAREAKIRRQFEEDPLVDNGVPYSRTLRTAGGEISTQQSPKPLLETTQVLELGRDYCSMKAVRRWRRGVAVVFSLDVHVAARRLCKVRVPSFTCGTGVSPVSPPAGRRCHRWVALGALRGCLRSAIPTRGTAVSAVKTQARRLCHKVREPFLYTL